MFGIDELGMDLGTSTLHIVVKGKGVVLSEPAYVAYDRQTRDVVAVGEEARRMYGRTPAGLIVERPLRDGRIRSFDLVSKMLRYFMRKVVGKRAAFRPRLLLALPGGMLPSERQTLVDKIWSCDSDYIDENALSVTVKRLRNKLGADCIGTVYGMGYVWKGAKK